MFSKLNHEYSIVINHAINQMFSEIRDIFSLVCDWIHIEKLTIYQLIFSNSSIEKLVQSILVSLSRLTSFSSMRREFELYVVENIVTTSIFDRRWHSILRDSTFRVFSCHYTFSLFRMFSFFHIFFEHVSESKQRTYNVFQKYFSKIAFLSKKYIDSISIW